MPNEPIIRIATPHPRRPIDVALPDRFACDSCNHLDELVNGDHFVGADINRPGEVRTCQPPRALKAFIDIEERSGLFSVAPNLDFTSVGRHRNFAAHGRGSFLPTIIPASLGPENIVVASDPNLHAVIAAIGEVETFAKQLFPSVLAIRCSRVGRRFGAIRIVGVDLVVFRIHTGRRGVENSLVVPAVSGVQDVEVDARRVVHHIGVVFSGEDVARSPHVGRELIDFVEAAVDHMAREIWVTQVADHEIIGLGLAEPRELEVHASYPEAFAFEPLH